MICDKNCFYCQHPDCIRDERQDDNDRAAEWRRNNPEKRKAIRRRYYERHKEQEKAYQRKYRQEHLEEIRERDRARKKAERAS